MEASLITDKQGYYDSHVHWLALGDFKQRLDLSSLKNMQDLLALKPQKQSFRGEWLLGFGWDDKLWGDDLKADAAHLDLAFPHNPVAFSKTDGHVVWCNTQALKILKIPLDDARLVKSNSGQATGLLLEGLRDNVLKALPPLSLKEIKQSLLRAQDVFIKEGFSHIRDVGCNSQQWQAALELGKHQMLKLHVEVFVYYSFEKDIMSFLKILKNMEAQETNNLKVRGVKFFLDGSLGSQTALVSEAYVGTNSQGYCALEFDQITQILKTVWQAGFEVAAHAIGDQAVHRLSLAAKSLWGSGIQGRLNIEHGQMMREETIALLKGEDVVVHMQPCHLLSDQKWIFDKLPKTLHSSLFPWAQLEKAKIPFYFGSDAPIEAVSVKNNLKALKLGENLGIRNIEADPLSYCRY